MTADDQTQENHTLYLFLANQKSITTNLRTELQAIDGYVIAYAYMFSCFTTALMMLLLSL